MNMKKSVNPKGNNLLHERLKISEVDLNLMKNFIYGTASRTGAK